MLRREKVTQLHKIIIFNRWRLSTTTNSARKVTLNPINYNFAYPDNLLGLLAHFGVDEGNVVVDGDAVSERGEALLHTLDTHGIGEGIADVLELLVGGGGREEESVSVADTHTANHSAVGYAHRHNRDVLGQLLLEHRVEVRACAQRHQTVRVRQLRKHTNVITRLKPCSQSHF